LSTVNPNVAKAEGAADAVSSAFPKGKQHGCFSGFLDITRGAFQKNTQKDRKERLLLLF
jgi:hypothetical protein